MQAWIAEQLLIVAIGGLEEPVAFPHQKLGTRRVTLIAGCCQAPVELILMACVDHEYLLNDLYVHQVCEYHHEEGGAPESMSWTHSSWLASDRALRPPGSDGAVRPHRGLYFWSKNRVDMSYVHFQ